MRGVFVDANESLAVIFERLEKPGDPKVRVNLRSRHHLGSIPRDARRRRDRDRRSHGAADRGREEMQRAEARRVSRHRRAQLHEPGRARRTRHRSAPDQGLWRHGGRRMRDRADVGGRARPRQDGPRDARRQLAARRRHAAHRQDARPDRLRRHRRGSRAHRARQRHARHRLEPVAEEASESRIRRPRRTADRERRRLDPSAAQRRDARADLAPPASRR